MKVFTAMPVRGFKPPDSTLASDKRYVLNHSVMRTPCFMYKINVSKFIECYISHELPMREILFLLQETSIYLSLAMQMTNDNNHKIPVLFHSVV